MRAAQHGGLTGPDSAETLRCPPGQNCRPLAITTSRCLSVQIGVGTTPAVWGVWGRRRDNLDGGCGRPAAARAGRRWGPSPATCSGTTRSPPALPSPIAAPSTVTRWKVAAFARSTLGTMGRWGLMPLRQSPVWHLLTRVRFEYPGSRVEHLQSPVLAPAPARVATHIAGDEGQQLLCNWLRQGPCVADCPGACRHTVGSIGRGVVRCVGRRAPPNIWSERPLSAAMSRNCCPGSEASPPCVEVGSVADGAAAARTALACLLCGFVSACGRDLRCWKRESTPHVLGIGSRTRKCLMLVPSYV